MAELLAGQLREELARIGARWSVNERLRDDEPVPEAALGIPPDAPLVRADEVPPLDLAALVGRPSGHPDIDRRRAAHGLLAGAAGPVAGNPRPAAVDWRSRWSWPWITKVKDQNPCESCWAFGATGVVESMARIEHGAWSKRSEGDVHDGLKASCGQGSWPSAALDWIRDNNGSCDPGCWPYSTPPASVPADQRDAWRADYHPTADRSGRTVKISGYQTIGDVEQQKVWLDTVGPLAACFEVWSDFYGLGSGVYHKAPSAVWRGNHCVLVVGYDDAAQCWLFKNSWGPGYHVGGFGRIGYGEVRIDEWAKYGLQGTNTDPWTKRRQHAGNVIESGNGRSHRNFELVATATGGQVQHWWREGDAPFGWSRAALFGNDAAACPTFTATTYNRNMEAVHLTTGGRLHHWFFDQAGGAWRDGGVFGPPDAAGVPAFIQSDYGAPGNLEVVVRTRDGRLNHWWRMNGAPWTWSDGGRFGADVAYSGPALVQTRARSLDLVAVRTDGRMQQWSRDDAHGFVWNAGAVFGAGVGSPPCMIEGHYGAADEDTAGNYELCVAVGGRVEHWWRDNHGGPGWQRSAVFGHDVGAVTGLVQGSFGFNLEVVVLRTDRQLQHYWRDGNGWHEGGVIGPA